MTSDQPTYQINKDGTKSWFLNGKLHRTDGPAVEDAGGTKYWYLNGAPHRTDGPAIEFADGSKVWYLNDKEIDHFMHWYLTNQQQQPEGQNVIA